METIIENDILTTSNDELEYTKNLVEECIGVLCYCCSFSFASLVNDTNSCIVFEFLEQKLKEKPELLRNNNNTQLEKIIKGIKKYEDETFDIENPNLMSCLYKCNEKNKKIYVPFLEMIGRKLAEMHLNNEEIEELNYIINHRYVLK